MKLNWIWHNNSWCLGVVGEYKTTIYQLEYKSVESNNRVVVGPIAAKFSEKPNSQPEITSVKRRRR